MAKRAGVAFLFVCRYKRRFDAPAVAGERPAARDVGRNKLSCLPTACRRARTSPADGDPTGPVKYRRGTVDDIIGWARIQSAEPAAWWR